MNELNLIKVCESHGKQCDCHGFIAEVGNNTHLFCCERGFERSLKDFQEHIANKDNAKENERIKALALRYVVERFGEDELSPEETAMFMSIYIDAYNECQKIKQ